MTNVVVVGSQWGDEGKGKLVDWLCERADVVVRFQGGHNAGHTIVVDGESYKLSLLPSGVVRKNKLGVIGNGVVMDPYALLEEIDRIAKQGIRITPENLRIAGNTCLILSVHRELDGLREDAAEQTGTSIGTTRRGIGPAYEDKVGRRAIHAMDLLNIDGLAPKVNRLLKHHNALRKGMGVAEIAPETLLSELKEIAGRITPYCDSAWKLLDEKCRSNAKILFEGAQGTLLDVDHGTYPFVTSSNTIAGQASAGSGVGPGKLDYVLGITKAYTTRVGEGPFPTELDDDVGQYLGERGHEFGTVTGRSRRCGWFDAALVRQSAAVNGIDGLAITKLDVMDGLETVKICVGYDVNGEHFDHLPPSEEMQALAKPVYESMPGWQEATAGARSYDELPAAAKAYLGRLEALVGTKIAVISTSPEREDTILVCDPFEGG